MKYWRNVVYKGPILKDGNLDFTKMLNGYAYITTRMKYKEPENVDDLLKLAQLTEFNQNEIYNNINIKKYESITDFLEYSNYKEGEYLVPWFILFHKYLEFYDLSDKHITSYRWHFVLNYPYERYRFTTMDIRHLFKAERMTFVKLNVDLNLPLEETLNLYFKYKRFRKSKWEKAELKKKKIRRQRWREIKRKRREALKIR